MKTLFLTGASGDIGEAILEKFKRENYYIIAPTRAELDLLSAVAIEKFMTGLAKTVNVDVYVHCAGYNDPKLLGTLTESDVQRTFQVNAMSFYSLCKHLSPSLMAQKQGSILAISSIYGDLSRKGRLAYTASKHALNGMVKTLALELGPYNIKVNGLAPGFVETKMTRKNNSNDVIEGLKKNVPLGRLAHVDDIADVAYFMCAANNYINGQCIIVDGGYSVGGFQE